MRKRLPQPKARIETLALVRPSVRLGRGATGGRPFVTSGKSERPTPALVTPRHSKNFRRDGARSMGTTSWEGNDYSAVAKNAAAGAQSLIGLPTTPDSLTL